MREEKGKVAEKEGRSREGGRAREGSAGGGPLWRRVVAGGRRLRGRGGGRARRALCRVGLLSTVSPPISGGARARMRECSNGTCDLWGLC